MLNFILCERATRDNELLTLLDDEGNSYKITEPTQQRFVELQLPHFGALDGAPIYLGNVHETLESASADVEDAEARLWKLAAVSRELGLSLRDIAQAIGVTHQTVANRLDA